MGLYGTTSGQTLVLGFPGFENGDGLLNMREPARTLLETMVNKIMGARTRSRRRQRPTP